MRVSIRSVRNQVSFRSLTRAALAALGLAASALAHNVFPASITLRPGGESYIYVVDTFGCAATIAATSTQPGLVKVAALDMGSFEVGPFQQSVSVAGRIDQVFVVRADASIAASASGAVEICWIGEDYPDPPCDENNCSPYAPHVVTIQIEPSPGTVGAASFAGIVGDPVTSDDGELFFVEPEDLALRGPLDVVFERYYASRLASEGNNAGALGPGWLHTYDWRLTDSGSAAEIATPTGRVIRFELDFATQTWQLAVFEDEPYQLVNSGPNRVLGDPRTGATYTFDAIGRLTAIADGKGNTLALTYSGSDLTQVSDGLGRVLTFTHSGGRMASVSDGTRTVSFGYTGGVLTSVVDAMGNSTSYAYDPAVAGDALLTARTLPEGNTPWTQSYDASERVNSQSDAFANKTALAFGATTTVTDPLGEAQVHTHSADSALTRLRDEGGTSATMTYDAENRRTSVTDRLGAKTSWTIHAPSGLPATITEADGTKTTLGYTARTAGGLTFYDLTSAAYADGTSESYARDAQGNLTQWIDRAGAVWTYTYDARGQVLTETNPEGGVTTNVYNADGTLASTTDHAGNATTFAYDTLFRPVSLVHPDTSDVTYVYDALDRLVSVTDELSRTTSFGYDDNSNLTTLTDPASEVWTFCYDAMDRLDCVADPLGNTTSLAYDERGQVETLVDGAGNVYTFGYDARGRGTSLADELGNAWTGTYDAEGVPKTAADPLSNAAALASDAMGRITSLTSALGHRTSYTYDALGRVTRVRDALDHATSVAYDARGDVASVSPPISGATTTVDRNSLGQVTAIEHPGGSTWSFGYDAQGRHTSTTDPLGNATAYAYDDRNRVEHADFPGGMGSVDLTWDDADNLLRALYSDGTDLQLQRDEHGRVTSASGVTFTYDDAGQVVESNGLLITRDAAGRITSIEYAPGLVVTYVYDERGLVTSLTDWLGGVTTFGYDERGLLTAIVRPNGVTTRYTYDADGRLIDITEEGPASPLAGRDGPVVQIARIRITRNARGEIVKAVREGLLLAAPVLGTVSRSYDAANQVVGWDYDALGNLRYADDMWGNTDFWCNCDLASRPTRVELKPATALAPVVYRFVFDVYGQMRERLAEALTGSTWISTTYRRNYALPRGPVAEIAVAGTVTFRNVFLPSGELLYRVDASNDARAYFHFDWLGSTVFLTDDLGAVAARLAYSTNGELLDSEGTIDTPHLYRANSGFVAVTDMLYLDGPRLYDACNGFYTSRWLSYPFVGRLTNAYGLDSGNPNSTASYFRTSAAAARLAQASTFALLTTLGIAADGILWPIPPQVLVDTRFLSVARSTETFGTGFNPLAGGSSPASVSITLSTADPSAVVPGFVGSMLAQAQTGSANGAAFVSDLGARNLALGALAFLLPYSESAASTVNGSPSAPRNYRELVDKLRAKFKPPPARIPIIGHLFRRFGATNVRANQTSTVLGRSLLIGGVLNDVRQAASRVPVLGNLPFLGQLFRQRGLRDGRSSLVISIRSTIVRDGGDL
jgi:YD repeat-containing protein